jgi:methyl-accepting chemotaxis protein
MNLDGTVIASSDESQLGKNLSNREFFSKRNRGEATISDATASDSSGLPVVTVAAPVMTDGAVAGHLFAVVALDYFNERFVLPIKVGETGRVLMFNRQGKAIIHPDPSKVLKLGLNALMTSSGTGSQKGAQLTEYVDDGERHKAAVKTMDELGWTILVDADQDEIDAPGKDVGISNILASAILLMILGVAIIAILERIIRPLRKSTEIMRLLAEGDVSVDVPALDRSDEIGEMATALQVFKDNAVRMGEMHKEKEESEHRAQEEKMQATAQQMSATAEETSRQSGNVASASDQATANVQTVAATAEQLSASISEIGRQVLQSAKIAQNAVVEAETTNETVQGLAEAASKIGDVVSLINDIAGQTNLLALNATIEAARAGEAGKGFAVVAQEVKNLANQTGKATEEISAQITAIQEQTTGAVDAIGKISSIIGEVNDIATTISSAVEEQGVSTQEIARNVQQAARGTQDVNQNIESVSKAVGQTGAAAGQVLNSAASLSQQSTHLQIQVEKFLGQIRAA